MIPEEHQCVVCGKDVDPVHRCLISNELYCYVCAKDYIHKHIEKCKCGAKPYVEITDTENVVIRCVCYSYEGPVDYIEEVMEAWRIANLRIDDIDHKGTEWYRKQFIDITDDSLRRPLDERFDLVAQLLPELLSRAHAIVEFVPNLSGDLLYDMQTSQQKADQFLKDVAEAKGRGEDPHDDTMYEIIYLVRALISWEQKVKAMMFLHGEV